jgi:YesN/AraC family two-component response regulator
MPEMAGPALAAQIKARHPDTHIILMSGIAQEPDEESTPTYAVRLVKPVTVETLTATIRSLIE